jgi:hypothetical protein
MTYTGQYKNNIKHGYGHSKWEDDGTVYYGQWKEGNREGYGFYKWPNGNEYNGEWKDNNRTGVGIFKNALTDRVEKGNYKDSELISVIEVIKP